MAFLGVVAGTALFLAPTHCALQIAASPNTASSCTLLLWHMALFFLLFEKYMTQARVL
jgi:hypothetical protein